MDEQKMKVVDYTFKLDEVVDGMHSSVSNAEAVIEQQRHLVKVVKASKDSKDFEEFLVSLEADIKSQSTKVEDLKNRVVQIEELVKLCRADETKQVATVVCSLLLEGLGIMRPESKQTEESKA